MVGNCRTASLYAVTAALNSRAREGQRGVARGEPRVELGQVGASHRLHRQSRARLGQDVVGDAQARDRSARPGRVRACSRAASACGTRCAAGRARGAAVASSGRRAHRAGAAAACGARRCASSATKRRTISLRSRTSRL